LAVTEYCIGVPIRESLLLAWVCRKLDKREQAADGNPKPFDTKSADRRAAQVEIARRLWMMGSYTRYGSTPGFGAEDFR